MPDLDEHTISMNCKYALVIPILLAVLVLSGCTQQSQSPPSNNNASYAPADENAPVAQPQTCSQLGGYGCKENEQCVGQLLNASDVTTCCAVVCTQKAGQESAKTCAEQNGFVCKADEQCEGTNLKASDATACCSKACTKIQTQSQGQPCPINVNEINFNLYYVQTNPSSKQPPKTFSDLLDGVDISGTLYSVYLIYDFSKPLENDFTTGESYEQYTKNLNGVYPHCYKGHATGENVNYLYCGRGLLRISKTPISESGEIQKTLKYVIYPVFDAKEITFTSISDSSLIPFKTFASVYGTDNSEKKTYQIIGANAKFECMTEDDWRIKQISDAFTRAGYG